MGKSCAYLREFRDKYFLLYYDEISVANRVVAIIKPIGKYESRILLQNGSSIDRKYFKGQKDILNMIEVFNDSW